MVVKYESPHHYQNEIDLQLLIHRLSDEQFHPICNKKIITILQEIIQREKHQ